MTDSGKLIGYEALIALYETMKASTPKGVGLKRETKGGKSYLQLQFTIGGKRVAKACNCTFTEDGIRNAVLKAQKVAEALTKFSTESEFLVWYDSEILEKNRIKNDLITFGEAIKLVEDDFWRGKSRTTKRKRDRNNPSDQASWDRVYWEYYKHLPSDKTMNASDFMEALDRWEPGIKSYKDAVSAMRKLARLAENSACIEKLNKIDSRQTEFRDDLQTIDIDEFLAIRDKVLGITEDLHRNANLDSRKDWMWVFSTQMVYGLRIGEVFAILNLTKSFKTPDGVTIPPLNDPTNKTNLIAIGMYTDIGTTTKTGYRLAAPIPHPRYPDLIERLEIKACRKPANKPREDSKPETIAAFYPHTAIKKLIKWHLDKTQTHALRHLANMNGRMSGVNPTALAQSLGHSLQTNENVYTKRQATKTTIDLLLNSQKQPLGLTSAIEVAKTLLTQHPSKVVHKAVIDLLAAIYHESADAITEMLRN
ncbi:MAG TPA: hypothetical protein DCY88_24980 [Cyanobacteria bacterium UBA11372]|nr:hypothetical protein [Cyanobacteria bacterium UBA11372]